MSLASSPWGTADTWAARSDRTTTLARLYIFFFVVVDLRPIDAVLAKRWRLTADGQKIDR
jgi:hypothetical protein